MDSKPSADSPPSAAPAGGGDAAIEALLGAGGAGSSRWRLLAIAGGFILLIVAGVFAYKALQPAPTPRFETQALRRGDLTVSVAATGTLQPVNQVDVGSEVSGTVDQVLVQENDLVTRGQVLATLDTSRLRDQVINSEAAVASAQADLAQANATVREAGLKAARLHRLLEISDGGYPARADIDAADASLARAGAGVTSAKARVLQAMAALNTSRTNMTKAVIRAPINGVVLARKVEPGQTVAASLQAPVLFTLAEDMRRMELHVDVDEADVSQVLAGQTATFNVDAWPNREFPATVTRVGLGSQTKESVVTYQAVLAVDNSGLSLRPGMTASAEIVSTRRPNVLIVPEAALRFQPSQAPAGASGLSGVLTPRMPRLGGPPVRRNNDAAAARIWVLKDGKPVAINVRVGATNGRETEVSGAGLALGLMVITGEAGAAR